MTLLEVCSLELTYPGTTGKVLRGASLAVERGGCMALLGPSGSGKSSLLRAIAGFETPGAGDVRVGDRSVTSLPPHRRPVSLVFQRPRLFPHLTVLDNVALSLEAQGSRRRAARSDAMRFLELVTATELASRRPATLSGGQEQRVALARALAARPEVLLLDEPFSGLDPVARDEMHALLRELRALVEPTLLMVTHDRSEAAAVADVAAVLLEGRIVQTGKLDDLLARPGSATLHRFLGGANVVRGEFDGRAHRSALGTLPVDAGATALPHGEYDLLLRQEALSLADPYSTMPDTVTGVVIENTRPGGAPRTIVDVGGVHLHIDRDYGQAEPAVGAQVDVVIPMAARWLVAADDQVTTAVVPPLHGESATQSIMRPMAQ